MVGGGLVGCETALGYAQAGKQVTILEALPDILSAGIPVPEMNDSMLRDLLDEAGVVRRTGRRLSRVTEDGAVADGPDGEEKLPADHIVLGGGIYPPDLPGAGTGRGGNGGLPGGRRQPGGQCDDRHWQRLHRGTDVVRRRRNPCEKISRMLAFIPSRC